MHRIIVLLSIVGLAVLAMTLAHAQATAPARQRAPEKLVLAVVLIADTNPREYILTINNAVGFKTVASLKKHIGDLPAGSTITWAPSDAVIGDELLGSEKERKDLAAFCEEQKVKLVVVPGG